MLAIELDTTRPVVSRCSLPSRAQRQLLLPPMAQHGSLQCMCMCMCICNLPACCLTGLLHTLPAVPRVL
jgi:hypothetical protein